VIIVIIEKGFQRRQRNEYITGMLKRKKKLLKEENFCPSVTETQTPPLMIEHLETSEVISVERGARMSCIGDNHRELYVL